MSVVLHLETSSDRCSIALSQDGELIVSRDATEPRQHIAMLSLLIDDLLEASEFSYHYLTAIAVSTGPGSYTGLRVGYATAKGLCMALDIPIIEVSTLYSLASTMKEKDPAYDLYVPVLNAHKREVYAAFYDETLDEIHPPFTWVFNEKSTLDLINQFNKVVFCGSGCNQISQIEGKISSSISLKDVPCSALHLIRPAWKKYQQKHFADLAYCEPLYLKPPNITRKKAHHM